MNALCTVGSSDTCSLLCQLGDTLLTNTSGGTGSSDAHPSPDHPADPESSRLKKVTLLGAFTGSTDVVHPLHIGSSCELRSRSFLPKCYLSSSKLRVLTPTPCLHSTTKNRQGTLPGATPRCWPRKPRNQY